MQQQVQQQKSDYKFSKGPSRFHNTGKTPRQHTFYSRGRYSHQDPLYIQSSNQKM